MSISFFPVATNILTNFFGYRLLDTHVWQLNQVALLYMKIWWV